MQLTERIDAAAASGALLESAAANLKRWLDGGFLPDWARRSIDELVEAEAWDELNDRFYQNLTFGTGGMRGRTIGNVCTEAEKGAPGERETPEHAAVGTNVLNDFNVVRATLGLYRYAEKYLCDQGRFDLPRLVIAHDVRHFSRRFCELAASTWCKLGGQAMIFDGPRSTPQLSFTVRHLRATAGVVVTASHNPPHDNGYKVYFEDGGQVVYPHAEGIVGWVNDVSLDEIPPYLEVDLEPVATLGVRADEAYEDALLEMIIDHENVREQAPRVVFSPIHGVGGVRTLPALERLGVDAVPVDEQGVQDPRFPTVESPNPENAEALRLAIDKAEAVDADLVIATDPDSDRMGVAVRGRDGKMCLLTGNQIGAMLAEYRIVTLKDAEILPEEGTERAALIKTFVTSPMQESIAAGHGLKTINTLTGFKWIGEKMRLYEEELKAKLFEKEGMAIDYDACDVWTRADMLLDYSTYFVFGGEESYGYLASDIVRDKDANGAALLFCELAAYLKSNDMGFLDFLDALYLDHGYHEERTVNLVYEGAAGSAKIKNILDSYREAPPESFDGTDVTGFTDFGSEDIRDADGKRVPPQAFYFLELENGYSVAVRGSGTEPKIKFYLFGRAEVESAETLERVKAETGEQMDRMASAIGADARRRAEA